MAELMSCSSTRSRMLIAAYAKRALRLKPNSVKVTIRRKRSLRQDRIRIDHAISDTVTRVNQRLLERFVDGRTQPVDVYAQGVRIRQLLAPHALLEILPRHHGRAGLHQRLQQLQADRVELDGLALAAHGERIEVVSQPAHLEHAVL